MSFAAAHTSRVAIETCKSSREHKARVRSRGALRADRDDHQTSLCEPHRARVLCFECWRSEHDRRGAALPAEVRLFQPPRPSFQPVRALAPSDITHRRRMLAAMLAQREGQ